MQPDFLKTKDGLSIAYQHVQGSRPAVMFLPGFFSHMRGTKATWLETCCRTRGQAYIRFDYRGHGESGGRFEDGTISGWLEDTLAVLDSVPDPDSPVIAVGSSMGGWIAFLAARARPGIICGIVGVAASPDFTRAIYEERLSAGQRTELHQMGYTLHESHYREEPVKITKKLIEDGEKHVLLQHHKLDLNIPVCLIHGKEDEDVSWQKSQKLRQLLGEEYCEFILIPDGKHRLSRARDLRVIDEAVQKISSLVNSAE